MAGLEDNPNDNQPDEFDLDFPPSFERPTLIDRAHEQARAAEKELNEFDGSHDERENHANTEIIPKLNAACGHLQSLILVNGDNVTVNRFDPTTLSSETPPEVMQEKRELNDQMAQSLGYIAIEASDDSDNYMDIRHLAEIGPLLITPKGRYGAAFQSITLELPIDERVDVKLIGEEFPPNVEMLRYYIPDIMNEIDEALKTPDHGESVEVEPNTLKKKLRKLSKIHIFDHEKLSDKGGQPLKDELLKYINAELHLDKPNMKGLFRISGSPEVIVSISGPFYTTVDKDSVSPVQGCLNHICVTPFEGDERLALSMKGWVELNGWHEMIFPLSPQIHVTPQPGINTRILEKNE